MTGNRITLFFLLLVTLSASLSAPLFGQGYRSSNQRNHPELTWQVAETEHFRIAYPKRLEGIEDLAAAIAEESYEALSNNLDVTFDRKIKIYLSDEDAIANGSAWPIIGGFTTIWVDMNEYAETWTGEVKWLRKVLAHELAHLFHFKAIESKAGMLQFLFANPLPRVWSEGLAQYETEKWDSERGDRDLRIAVFDDQMSTGNSAAIDNGGLIYASGNSQLRYFAQTYGDSTLAKLLTHRKKWMGLIKIHDFYDAFKATTGDNYRQFYDAWRKHVNIYYNTLASQLQRTDSLDAPFKPIPGRFIFDLEVSPDEQKIAVLLYPSPKRPVKRLYVVENDSTPSPKLLADGSIRSDISWSPDGSKLIYSRTNRAKYGSIVPDLYLYDLESGTENRITNGRRAQFPVFSPDANEIAYVATENGVANIYRRDLTSGEEEAVTDYRGNVELLHLAWNHKRNLLIFQKFDQGGDRHLVLHNIKTGQEQLIGDGAVDNRHPVISPDGNRMAFTSLRDEVPNVFIYDFETDSTRRVTNLVTGGTAYGWLSPPGASDSTETENSWSEEGRLILKATEQRTRDRVYLHDAANRAPERDSLSVPDAYSRWRKAAPPNIIPYHVEPNGALITQRSSYSHIGNVGHVFSFGVPIPESAEDIGLAGATVWADPLAKHQFLVAGNLSFTSFQQNSGGIVSYTNNRWYPSFTLSSYRTDRAQQWYQDRYLFERISGFELQASIPLNTFDGAYQNSSFLALLRYADYDPLAADRFATGSEGVIAPQQGEQAEFGIGWALQAQRPWSQNVIHPLDGYGIRLTVRGALPLWNAETEYIQPDLTAYKIFPSIGLHRIYAMGRLQAQLGDALPQKYIGFSRYDNIQPPFGQQLSFLASDDAVRVRGYRDFTAGEQVAFGSVEYRIPLLSSLRTRILGFLGFGGVSMALFADGGVVWNTRSPLTDRDERLGLGAELKNQLSLGPLSFGHAVGIGQPYDQLGSEEVYDLYYRVKAAVAF